MKKFFMIISLIFAMFVFVSCGADEEDLGDLVDTGNGSSGNNSGSNSGSDSGDSSNQDNNQENNGSQGGNSGSDTGNNGTNPGGDTGDTGNNPGNDTGDTGNNPGNGDNGNTNPGNGDNGDSGDSGYNPPDNGDSGDNGGNDTTSCKEITLGTDITFKKDVPGYYMSYTPNTGSSKTDTFGMEYEYLNPNSLKGEHYLSGTNYGDKDGLFLIVYEDENGDGAARYYFQKKGTVDVTSYDASTNAITAKLTGVVLEEVDIDFENLTYESTPVLNGKCLKVKDTTISFGNGGNGGNDEPETGCTTITLGTFEAAPISDDIPAYYASYTPNTGGSASDRFGIEFNNLPAGDDDAVDGKYNLKDTNYSEEGILDLIVYEDNDTNFYFQKEGEVKISGYDSTNKVTVEFLTDVILEEVEINGLNYTDNTKPEYYSKKVTNGKCLKVEKNTKVQFTK